MDNTGSTATVECAFKHILNTFSNREKKYVPKSLYAHQVAIIIESSNEICDGFAEEMKNASNIN